MNTQRKICSAVLTLAAAAFAVDHWFLGTGSNGSSPSQANGAVIASAANPAGRDQAKGVAQSGKPGPVSLAARLQAAVEVERVQTKDIADAFVASDKLIPPPPPPAPVAVKATVQTAKVDPAVQFRATHKVTAVLNGRGNRTGMALVSGRTVLVGQQLDGFTLISVNAQDRTAVFSDGAVRAELGISAK